MRNVTESIWSKDGLVIPMFDVQHIEKLSIGGLWVITKHTKYNFDKDLWENPIFIPPENKDLFLIDFCNYRHELEKDTLIDMP